MREMGSFFRKKDSSDKKRFRKPPFGIKRDAEPASEKELKDAVKAIQKDAEYALGKRIRKRVSVDFLKDEFNTVSNWVKKFFLNLRIKKKHLAGWRNQLMMHLITYSMKN